LADEGYKRKLAAILSADVKGYSLLMADDELFTIKTLKEFRQIMSKLIVQHFGRLVDSPGDNMLAEFSSAVNAVECAIDIQKSLKKENDRFVENKKLQFRIGVNIGDVVQDGESIYGDGVNVAARIEGIADPGGVCISRSAYDQIKGKLEFEFEYLGEYEVKNIKEPVRVYKIQLESDSTKPLVDKELELPDKPSIAVLPFVNMSGNPSQEYFSDGLTEQIINGICKVSNLFVIARNSTFAYKGKSVNVQQVGKELGVRYILEGSVQRAGDRVRITAQLIDTKTGYHLWSENYDRDLSDIFALQDEITKKLILSMHIKLIDGEQARFWERSVSNIQAYDMYQRGSECFHRYNEKENKQARNYFMEAINLDKSCAMYYCLLGYTHIMDLGYNWSKSSVESFEQAEKCAENALKLEEDLDVVHMLLGWIYLIKRQYDEAIKECERAVELNPNGAEAHLNLGFILTCSGKPGLGIQFINRAFRLNPIPPPRYYYVSAMVHRANRQHEKAIELSKKSLSGTPDQLQVYIILAASYISLNRTEEARKAAMEILRIEPKFSLEYYVKMLPLKNQAAVDKLAEELRKAGLPE